MMEGMTIATTTARLAERRPEPGGPGDPRRRRPLPLALLAAVRPRQCVTKNAIVFGALVFARKLFEPLPVLHVIAAFALFCAVSGAVYLINDLLDVEQDRLHPR